MAGVKGRSGGAREGSGRKAQYLKIALNSRSLEALEKLRSMGAFRWAGEEVYLSVLLEQALSQDLKDREVLAEDK